MFCCTSLYVHSSFAALLSLRFLVSRDCCVALPRGAMGLSAAFDCGISWSYSLTILVKSLFRRTIRETRKGSYA